MKFTPEIIAALQTLKDAAENNFEKRNIEIFSENLKSGNFKTRHLMAGSKIYNCWSRMKGRCLNPKNKNFNDYGGRGITVCPEWIDNFQAFYDYVSNLPHFGEEGYSLDRIDVNGNYEPNNIRWADKFTQSRNRRGVNYVNYQGKSMTLAELSQKTNINLQTLCSRIKAGDTGERLVRPVEEKYHSHANNVAK